MSKKTKVVLRSKSVMYEQQLDHLSHDLPTLVSNVKKLKPKMWAYIVHDQDVTRDGKPVAPHVHVMLTFDNARSVNAIAKALNDKPQYVQAWRGDKRNGYAYLCHRTDNARSKFQYDPADVVANFDYVAALEQFEAGASAGRKTASIPVLLDALYRGNISRDELTANLTGSQIANNARAVSAVMAERLRREAIEWRQKMIQSGKTVDVYWLWGKSETGKTRYARKLAKLLSEDGKYFMSGSSRGVFEGYGGQHVLILDELSPNTVPYSDLKRITDPHGVQDIIKAPARYHDVYLMPEVIIVTSPFSPIDLYQKQVFDNVDTFEQLARRVTFPVRMWKDSIELMEYNPIRQRYDPVPNATYFNPYSSASSPVVTNAVTRFDQMHNLVIAS